ncbi:Cytochrome b-c1 complex subunit 1, mitochondrial [Frankliniella fusca]|uniref:Cytochrome b-c1 complex subunit 1, mitochondrial n=1 Tax=Frankliniella fusca TaxID=407009 RepID=A0AAE1H3K0_9NEOP|nr:Cytochrome b-c1 complex subunit 1, mitochondrial [Frankliniella fusca]
MSETSSSVFDGHEVAVGQGQGVQPKMLAEPDDCEVEAPTPVVRGVTSEKGEQTTLVTGEDADSDLGTAEDSSSPRSDFHDDESSLEQNIQINCDKLDKEYDRDSPVEKCQSPIKTELIKGVEDISSKSVEKPNEKQVENSSVSNHSQIPVEDEWEYRLPSPPSAFRDSRSHSPSVTEIDSVNLAETHLNNSGGLPGWEEKMDKSSTKDVSSEPECDYIKTPPSLGNAPTDPYLDSRADQEVTLPNETASLSVKSPATETVIKATQPVIPSTNVPNEPDKNLKGSAAVLDELNKVLSEQRSNILSTQNSLPSQSELSQQSGHPPAPIENFSMAVYSRPTSAEGMPPPEVRPSLVLARRSSFSNSNGSLNTLLRPIGTGVRRTTSHATLVGGRREANGVNNNSIAMDNVRSSKENQKSDPASSRQEAMGRAVSEMNLCAEPELFKEFMEWRQQRQKEMEEKEKKQRPNPTLDLQSPQMLRNIMSQSQDDVSGKVEAEKEKENSKPVQVYSENTQKKEAERKPNEEILKPASNEPVKRFVPRGPPSVQLSTWSERPVRQVSIKMDRDYWIGVGGAALRPTQRSRDLVDGSETKTQSESPTIEDQRKAAPPPQNVQRLSRQYIVHTTPSGFKRSPDPVENGVVSAGTIEKPQTNKLSSSAEPEAVKTAKLVSSVSGGELPDKFERVDDGVHHIEVPPETKSVEVPVTSKSDPSRVPIVRAVELKKTVSPDFRKPLLRQNATATSPNSSVVYFSSGPVATSSITANGNSVNISSASKTSPPVKKFTSVVDISGPPSEKTTSRASETQHLSMKPSVQVNGFSSNSEHKRNLPMPVVKGFKIAQGVVNRQLSAPAATPAPPAHTPIPSSTPSVTSINAPAPPPAPVMPVLKKIPRPSSLPARVQDPRDQLLEAIRNFGGRTKLRPTI